MQALGMEERATVHAPPGRTRPRITCVKVALLGLVAVAGLYLSGWGHLDIHGFAFATNAVHATGSQTRSGTAQAQINPLNPLGLKNPVQDSLERQEILIKSAVGGVPPEQAIAEALAGKHDQKAMESEVLDLAKSAPVVVFTWDNSPSCKQAIRYLEQAGAKPKIIRLDQPWKWDIGAQQRAALGRLTKRSSVPSVWIGGEFVGGCNDGPSKNAPGLVKLAFSGELITKLKDAQATPEAVAEAAAKKAVEAKAAAEKAEAEKAAAEKDADEKAAAEKAAAEKAEAAKAAAAKAVAEKAAADMAAAEQKAAAVKAVAEKDAAAAKAAAEKAAAEKAAAEQAEAERVAAERAQKMEVMLEEMYDIADE
jgi:glutaredoxin